MVESSVLEVFQCFDVGRQPLTYRRTTRSTASRERAVLLVPASRVAAQRGVFFMWRTRHEKFMQETAT